MATVGSGKYDDSKSTIRYSCFSISNWKLFIGIFFLQPLSSGTTTSCATTNNCCRVRCPIAATPICGEADPANPTFFCKAAAAAPATAPGTPCIYDGTCAACLTDTTITCNGRLECTRTPGADICALF